MSETDLCLNALLIVGLLFAVTNARSHAVERRVRREMGHAYSGFTTLAAWLTIGLWGWFAFLTGYWQIGALVVGGLVMRVGINVALDGKEATR